MRTRLQFNSVLKANDKCQQQQQELLYKHVHFYLKFFFYFVSMKNSIFLYDKYFARERLSTICSAITESVLKHLLRILF